jgi:head-tail adaptor
MRRAGLRNTPVTLQARTVAAESGNVGGFTETWTNLDPADVWAAVRSVGGGEGIAGNAGRAVRMREVEIDYHPSITTTCRVVLGTRYLHVVDVNDVEERHITHVLTCEEHA